ncbi:late competence development ComFB family protein [Tepidimicrobium xylanilyticum]|uniref:Late competence development protein ComFB n=1 Tax=Tepidimicrobium xylanilyticum TaxID=1123352 RepID=A0A1H2WJ78_9FIRM|nr:late competence development ComFB family protein [Tepidimicrobium xylanilyticum]GMG95236.1 hypothetical protein EN5CB1_00620 [Tepidimicrobium xylanilyticum]SDW80069.1 Late competence development protein ComFB [Tepidimicrobium xylanilyticum]
MVQNYMEVLVDEIFEEIKHLCKSCKKPYYQDDIKSVALNNLPPVYFLSSTTDAEKKAFLLDRQRRITVLAALTQAKDIVCDKCRYTKENNVEKMRDTM